MKKHLLDIGTTLLFGISIFIFYAFFYRFHLSYQEQYQMFLFTSDYLAETVAKPGGFSEYITRFLIQFYAIHWIGAFIMASLLLLLQRELGFISFRMSGKSTFLPLTYIPSLLYAILFTDENMMLSGVVSLVLALAFLCFSLTIKHRNVRIGFSLLMLPFLYILTGVGAFIIIPLSFLYEYFVAPESKKESFLYLLFSFSIFLVLPFVTRLLLPQMPLSKLWTGVDIYRFRNILPSSIYPVWISLILIPVFIKLLPEYKGKKKIITRSLLMLICLGILFQGLRTTADWGKEETMAYDYYTHRKQWDKVIEMADRKIPSSPLTVACLNLALAKKGVLGEKMFDYFQNGPEGLLPSFMIDFTFPMVAGEIYYHVGFINTAQRFVFEAMEAIPDCQKSIRAIQRLAETNLINGEYAVARKYLLFLQHTFFYREWAGEQLALLDNEEKISAHPEWSHFRQIRTQEDFLFSEPEKDMMLGILFRQNISNRIAYEYLLSYALLTKNLQAFLNYFRLERGFEYNQIPKSWQEALIYIWGLTNNDPAQTIPYPVSDQVKRKVSGYQRVYTSYQHPEPMLRKEYSNTYWYYFHFRK